VRKFLCRFMLFLTALSFYISTNSPVDASEQWFRLNPEEQERIIHSKDELPSLWLNEILRTVNEHYLVALLESSNVKAYRFQKNILLKLEFQSWMIRSQIYISDGRKLEHVNFTTILPSGELGVISHLSFVEVDAKSQRLISTACSDAVSLGCGRSTYNYNGEYFLLEKVEGQLKADGPWLPVWIATKIAPPK